MKTKYTPTEAQLDVAMDQMSLDAGYGLCLACGVEVDGLESDARNMKCYDCGEFAVSGAEEVVLMGGF